MLQFTGFNGAIKSQHPLMLPQGIGQASLNQRPGRGDLRPWPAPKAAHALQGSGSASIYRMGRDTPSASSYWLSWSTDVDVVRSMIADDTTERTYWTGDGPPKWTDSTIGLSAEPYPTVARLLGVPAPVTAPTITVTPSGTGNQETRYYVWTWVTARGEESAPSPVSAQIDCKTTDVILVTLNTAAVPQQRDISKVRIYRTVTGASGDTSFYFIYEGAIYGSEFLLYDVDNNHPPAEPIASTAWLEPPAGLRGLRACWNGMMAGFVGKSVRFCEPYRPFAWPIEYELTFDDTVVALGVWGQQLIVLTNGKPHIITGSEPGSMADQPLEFRQACVSKRSVVELGHGVAWASQDGLCYYGTNGAKVLTQGIFLREDWQELVPSSIVATAYEGAYMASFTPASGAAGGFIIDAASPQSVYFTDQAFSAYFADPIADKLFAARAGTVYEWAADSTSLTASHTTRMEQLPNPVSLPWCAVAADAYPVTISVQADGLALLTGRTVTSREPFRLPGGARASRWSVSVSTTHPVQAVLLGDSAAQMGG